MSESIYRLGLMAVVYSQMNKGGVSHDQSPTLVEYLDRQAIPLNKEGLLEHITRSYEVVVRELDYYDESELLVNQLLERYLVQLLEDMNAGNRYRARDVSMMLCSLGNKNNEHECGNAVGAIIDKANALLDNFSSPDRLSDLSIEACNSIASQLTYLMKILSLVDVFVTSRLGIVAGLEEYAPLDYTNLVPEKVTDWEVNEDACSTTPDCQCGCAFEHPLKLLQGMEDFLDGVETEDSAYFEGVARANNIRLEQLTGNEGPIFDQIKDLGRKAYDAVMAAWKNVKDWFDSSDKDKNEAVVDEADDNKKAIQSMPTDGVKLNDSAKKGISALAEKIDPTGAMGKIVAKLTSPSSASGVIDGLMGLLTKQSASGSDLQEKKKAAEDALAELKKAGDQANGDDSNKDAASAVRSGMKEKIKTAKGAVSAAKKAVSEHNKITSGIRKAISGITPHIFIKEGAAPGNEDDTDEKKKKAGNK